MNPRIVSLTTYLIVIVVLCDQVSKRLADALLPKDGVVPLTSFLSLGLTWNHGLDLNYSFYDFSPLVAYCLIVIELFVFFLFSRWRLNTTSLLVGTGLGLGMGGVLGNLIDRLRFSAVVDFINVGIGGFLVHYNFAEIAVIVSIGLLVLDASIGAAPAPPAKIPAPRN